MTADRTLQKIYEKRLSSLGIVTPLEKAVCAFIRSNPPVLSVWDQLTFSEDENKISAKKIQKLLLDDPWNQLERWRELLAVNLMASLQEVPSLYRESISFEINARLKVSLWDGFQLYHAFSALNRCLAALETPILQPYILSSGAVPLDSAGHWSWGEIPHLNGHAELGILWCLLGKIGNQPELLSAAIKLAEWQLNTLDAYFVPFSSLFIQETDACLCAQLSNNYLLFYAVGCLTDNPEMKYAAQKQLEQLESRAPVQKVKIAPLAVLLELWIKRLKQEKTHAVKFELPKKINDPHTALVGLRSPPLNLVCTAFGGKTGLGCLHYHDIQIVNYGPQHLPLAECQGFGIEGGAFSYQSHLPPTIESMNDAFVIQRSVRLASKPQDVVSNEPLFFRKGAYSGIWLDLKQHFQGNRLYIEAAFLGAQPIEEVAFTFFLKGNSCAIESDGEKEIKQLYPQSLDRYQGNLQKVRLQGERAQLSINPLWKEGEMQLIPLAGDDSFWGADFLLAYLAPPGELQLKWEVLLPS